MIGIFYGQLIRPGFSPPDNDTSLLDLLKSLSLSLLFTLHVIKLGTNTTTSSCCACHVFLPSSVTRYSTTVHITPFSSTHTTPTSKTSQSKSHHYYTAHIYIHTYLSIHSVCLSCGRSNNLGSKTEQCFTHPTPTNRFPKRTLSKIKKIVREDRSDEIQSVFQLECSLSLSLSRTCLNCRVSPTSVQGNRKRYTHRWTARLHTHAS